MTYRIAPFSTAECDLTNFLQFNSVQMNTCHPNVLARPLHNEHSDGKTKSVNCVLPAKANSNHMRNDACVFFST